MSLQVGERTFEERMYDLLDVTEYRKMESVEDRYLAYRLRHDAYLRQGCIDEDPDGISTDFADEEPNTYTYGVFLAGKLSSTLRLSVLTSECPRSPAMLHNSKVLQPKLDAGEVLIDPSRFSSDLQATRDFPELPYLTLRIAAMASEHYTADECLSYCRATHQAFYRRIFKSKPIADPVFYEMLRMNIQLMSTTVKAIREDVARRYPFFRSTYLERRALFGQASLIPGVTAERENKLAA